jgi:hypothetical protein
MANQGYPFEGADKRLLGGIFAKLATWLTFKSEHQPISFILQFPLGFRFYFPVIKGKILMVRAGWHWDQNAKAYIPGIALKLVTSPSLY